MKYLKNIEDFISEGSDVFDDKTRSVLSQANNIVKDAKNIDEVETKLKDLFKDSDKEESEYMINYLKNEWKNKKSNESVEYFNEDSINTAEISDFYGTMGTLIVEKESKDRIRLTIKEGNKHMDIQVNINDIFEVIQKLEITDID
jgi:hypothetical protein